VGGGEPALFGHALQGQAGLAEEFQRLGQFGIIGTDTNGTKPERTLLME